MAYKYNKEFPFEIGSPGKIDKAIFGIHPDFRVLQLELSLSFSDGSATFLFFSVEDTMVILKAAKKNYIQQLEGVPILANKTDGATTDFRIMTEVL